jgi:hypothetical protein
MASNIMGWDKESAEWLAIRNELVDQWRAHGMRPSAAPTAAQITIEQRRRMLARGDRPMTLDEIHEWAVNHPQSASST